MTFDELVTLANECFQFHANDKRNRLESGEVKYTGLVDIIEKRCKIHSASVDETSRIHDMTHTIVWTFNTMVSRGWKRQE